MNVLSKGGDASPARESRQTSKTSQTTTLQSDRKQATSALPVSHLDLAAKVRFSNHNTRYDPPEDISLIQMGFGRAQVTPNQDRDLDLEISTLDGARLLYDSLSSSSSFGRIAVLNFASATRPGGGFLSGAQAQEESIARSSTLFPSLMTDTAQQFHRLHLRDRQGGLYHHAMIHSPSVVWVTPFEIDILTSAAVNAGDVRNKSGRHADQAKVESMIESTMKERMGRILFLMEQQGAKNLVLGSFGTGVFRNSVEMVAGIWADLLTGKDARYRSSFDRVVFAILGTSTFTTFKKAFKNPARS
ncbi:hypothetical protein EV363DRAFT_1384412 [Boletus edulis]|nr:hypothetical protein EV363DRAFT_1384412 [Boletus edulis]